MRKAAASLIEAAGGKGEPDMPSDDTRQRLSDRLVGQLELLVLAAIVLTVIGWLYIW